ncbi:type III-A CRISPR-associated protein Csm2 [Methanococcus aeolicus]|uniref:CRISPR system Cms protein Csm2 n=1 Tax=Methanococcus aeolicus (strain ATCC BAA-1280 / DSM 17508 / OCM 812 / Nankai-3) TaxID=419665 RepID=A6UVY7_META3|nr:type III-A CRISPR-associated protein Csm2 [Methanococcus aeolicus]ABR56659.1 CRISPR-associated protein, Csm2 family [Methanococcus aeolicus Nankai-3]UXM84662.1 type III-A CRISPR-associated protein Csm2 [Methanococcus aeolicus]
MNWANNPNVKFKGGGNFMGNQKKNHNSGKKEEESVQSNDDINKILNLRPENIGILINKAEKFAEEIKAMPSSKLRDFYDYVVQIDESMSEDEDNNNNWYLKLMLLKPKMAYQASKETNKGKQIALKMLEKEFTKILDTIKNDKNKFKNFKTFFEAVVAYHKGHNNQ